MISTCDPANLPEAHTDDNPSEHNHPCVCGQCGQGFDATCPRCKSIHVEAENPPNVGTARGLMERFRALMLSAMEKRNTKYWLGCILIATGDAAAEGISLGAYARQWGLTTAAVSKHCVSICVQLGIKPSRGMLSEEAREQYRKHNVRKVKV